MIFVIDDDDIMAECIARACKNALTDTSVSQKTGVNAQNALNDTNVPNATNVSFRTKIFSNAIDAMNAISDGQLPSLIFLDILLNGPDGFALLNELVSYTDTANIPIVIISTLDFTHHDLSAYGVVGTLKKDTLTPQDIQRYVHTYIK